MVLRLVSPDETAAPVVQQDVVQLLEAMLEAARAGQIEALSAIVVTEEGAVFTESAGEVDDQLGQLVLGAEQLKLDLLGVD